MTNSLKYKKIIIGAVALIALATLVLFLFKKKEIVIIKNNHVKMDFSDPIFDGAVKIDNSNIVLEYPTKGFYGLGVKVNNYEGKYIVAGKEIMTATEYDPEMLGGFVDLQVFLENNTKKQTLGDLIATMPPTPERDRALRGKIETVGGRKYYVYDNSTSSGHDVLRAFTAKTLEGDKVLTIYFGGWISTSSVPEPSSETQIAVKKYDQLFGMILEHVKF